MRTGVLLRAVCQVLLHILSARFACNPLVVSAHSNRVLAMPYGVTRSRLSQGHVLLRIFFRWFSVTSTSVKNVTVGACSARHVNLRVRAVDDTQNQGTDEAKGDGLTVRLLHGGLFEHTFCGGGGTDLAGSG